MSDTTKTEVRVIEGWAQHTDADHGTGYELGGGAGWCDFSECGDPAHGDKQATMVINAKAVPMSTVVELYKDAKMIARTVAALQMSKEERMAIVDHDFAEIAAKYGIKLP